MQAKKEVLALALAGPAGSEHTVGYQDRKLSSFVRCGMQDSYYRWRFHLGRVTGKMSPGIKKESERSWPGGEHGETRVGRRFWATMPHGASNPSMVSY